MRNVFKCRICGSEDLSMVFSLGEQPLANDFQETPNKEVQKYPLDLYQCQHCTLLQLGYVASRDQMYREYFYIPSVSRTGLEHFEKLADKLTDKLNLKPGDLVVDIGGNDGSLSKFFEKKGMVVLNVDPAKNIKCKVPVVTEFFDEEVARSIIAVKGKAKLITGTNVFAHVDDLHAFLKAIDILLDKDGVFFAQFPDARNLLSQNQFDTIYHEHLSYFTYEPLHHLFSNSPFELFDFTSDNIHGGSMQIWVRRRKPLVQDFARESRENMRVLSELIEDYAEKGRKIVGFAAAAKGTVMLNAIGKAARHIKYVVDGTSYKQGKYIPGVNIPIFPEEKLAVESPGCVVLILAWNFEAEIINKLRNLKEYTFIIPVPEVSIYEYGKKRSLVSSS